MSQRNSEYERQPRDAYETPAWVTLALGPHLPEHVRRIWEPASGSGNMVTALLVLGFEVEASDIEGGIDFLSPHDAFCHPVFDAIITNPPYALAQEFIERALVLTEPRHGLVAMLLRCDYDHARTRTHLFGGCQAFAKKLVLTRRVRWFEDSKGSPSFNHAWFIWDWRHEGAPTLVYGP